MSVDFGELVFLTGESGSGKTSIINVVAGIKRATAGEVLVRGRSISSMNAFELRVLRHHVGVVYQNLRLLPHQTVIENVILPLRFNKFVGREREMALQALEQVGIPHLADKAVSVLSGGEQQRVAIARAVASGAEIIIADEPTGNLDDENSRNVIAVLEKLVKAGMAVVVTTHDLSLIGSHKHYVLRDGVVDELSA